MARKLIQEQVVYHRVINGTNWPVLDQLHQDGSKWIIVRGLCNGVPDSSKTYKTERAARQQWGLREVQL